MFNIQDINSSISQNNGVLFSSHFYVQITPPKCLQQGGQGSIVQSIPTFCDATQMPGLQYSPIDIQTSGYGLYESRPIRADFPNQNFSFYCDGNGKLQQLFQKWMQNIQNFDINQNASTTVNGAASGIFNYPDWYQATIMIFQYDPTGKNVVNRWTLYNAYPLTLNPIPIGWEQEDQLLKLSVDFYYKAWGTEAISPGSTPSSSDGSSSNSYSLTRVDPGVANALSSPEARNSAINGTFTTNAYAPLTTDSSTSAPSITGNAPTGITTNPSNVPTFSQTNTSYDVGFGSTFQTF